MTFVFSSPYKRWSEQVRCKSHKNGKLREVKSGRKTQLLCSGNKSQKSFHSKLQDLKLERNFKNILRKQTEFGKLLWSAISFSTASLWRIHFRWRRSNTWLLFISQTNYTLTTMKKKNLTDWANQSKTFRLILVWSSRTSSHETISNEDIFVSQDQPLLTWQLSATLEKDKFRKHFQMLNLCSGLCAYT